MSLVLQFLVLGFTVIVWWLARRDLTRQAVERHTPAVQEWERLQETVDQLIADLERRATLAEQRVAAAERRMSEAIGGLPPDFTAPMPVPTPVPSTARASDNPASASGQVAAHDALYGPIYALADAGVSDMAEIARRTGFGQGEVSMILGLRARRPRD